MLTAAEEAIAKDLEYYSDNMRHLVCYPYSIRNLHIMAKDLGLDRCWFHSNHYDIPKRRPDEFRDKTNRVCARSIVKIIRGEWPE